MGRHATVAGRQASAWAAKGRTFTKIAREVTIAARMGGGDPATNPRLRVAMEKAREANMPKDNVERAIKKGTGELEGVTYEEVTYEGYGPGGMAFIAEIVTDNRNRTGPEIKRILGKHGGTMGEMGSVAWMFKRKGLVVVPMEGRSEDQVMEIALEAGAEDVSIEDGIAVVTCEVQDFGTVRAAVEKAGLPIQRSGLEFLADNSVALNAESGQTALNLLSALNEHDDVQNVYHNAEIPDELLG